MARALATRLGYRYIDSGAMYRAVALWALENGWARGGRVLDEDSLVQSLPHVHIDFAIIDGKQHVMLNGRDVEALIRGIEVSNVVSPIAAIPPVRRDQVKRQQTLGQQKGIVMDGRDIGTTVFPDAELKIFVNAPAATRARRRYDELCAKGITTSYEDVLANIEQRDHLDRTRSESPLRRAHDAVDLDNTSMSIQEQDAWLDQLVSERLG